jgi:hypothetical protein
VHAFRLTRLVVDADGHTDFVDDEVPFDGQIHSPPAEPAGRAHLGVAESVSVMRADRDWGGQAFHPAPRRQLLTLIAGTWHVRTSRGTERTFGIGQSLLVEDVSGLGHSSRALEDGSMALVTALPNRR